MASPKFNRRALKFNDWLYKAWLVGIVLFAVAFILALVISAQ